MNAISLAKTDSGRFRSVGMWIYRILVALMFIAAAGMKLSSQPMMVTEFDHVGLGQWFRYFTGALELTGAVLVLLPRYTAIGAILLLTIDAGAFVAQVSVLHMDWVHTIVIGALLAGLAYLARPLATFRGKSSES